MKNKAFILLLVVAVMSASVFSVAFAETNSGSGGYNGYPWTSYGAVYSQSYTAQLTYSDNGATTIKITGSGVEYLDAAHSQEGPISVPTHSGTSSVTTGRTLSGVYSLKYITFKYYIGSSIVRSRTIAP